MIKIKKIKYSKVILSFVIVFLLVLSISGISKSGGYTCVEIIDINDRLGNVLLVGHAVEHNILRKAIEDTIALIVEELGGKTLYDIKDKISNTLLVGWTLEYMYNKGYRIDCVIGDWIILVNE